MMTRAYLELLTGRLVECLLPMLLSFSFSSIGVAAR